MGWVETSGFSIPLTKRTELMSWDTCLADKGSSRDLGDLRQRRAPHTHKEKERERKANTG